MSRAQAVYKWIDRQIDDAAVGAASAGVVMAAYGVGASGISPWWLLIPVLLMVFVRNQGAEKSESAGFMKATSMFLDVAKVGGEVTFDITLNDRRANPKPGVYEKAEVKAEARTQETQS